MSGSHAPDELLTLYVKANIDRSTTKKRFLKNIFSSPQPFQALKPKETSKQIMFSKQTRFFQVPGPSKHQILRNIQITPSDPHHGISKHSVL